MNTCPNCTNMFSKTRDNQIYCSLSCKKSAMWKRKYEKQKLIKNTNCQHCNKLTHNKKFCSTSCSNLYFSIISEQRKYYCQSCNKLLKIGYKGSRSKYCNDCNKNYVDWSKVTIKEYKAKLNNTYQFHARVRSLARQNTEIKPCQCCGYDKHVQVCHIKPVAEFDDLDTIAQVNDSSNLICLCPNCHWEFDHNLIKVAPPYTAYG